MQFTRFVLALAFTGSAAMALGGCFAHDPHHAPVYTQPAPAHGTVQQPVYVQPAHGQGYAQPAHGQTVYVHH